MKQKIFCKVKCKAYLKKSEDNTCIVMYDRHGMPIEGKTTRDPESKAFATWHIYKDGKWKTKESDDLGFEGNTVPKRYRDRVEEDFTGFLVGFTHIRTEGRIGTDWECDPYSGEFGHCIQCDVKYPRVAVVYFKNNAKRYVLPEDMEYCEEDNK